MAVTVEAPPPPATGQIQIVSASVCPFAQRTRLVLLEKGLAFDLIEIDVRHKPAWLKDLSPYEKVPAIRHGETRVYESAIINEYLEEVFPEPPLMPRDPGLRAQVRIWIDYCNAQFIPAYYKLLLAQNADKQAHLADKVRAQLRFVEREGLARLSGAGPYWLGADFSLLDATWYPFLERFCVAEHYRDVHVPEDCPRLRAWFAEVQQRASARATANPRDYYIKAYARYADGSVTGRTADEFRTN